MRILKYIFVLLLLSIVALSIFIATQKGDFIIERSKIINSPKSAAYNYVNDYKNWPEFGSWTTKDPEMKITFPAVTSGKGASFSWAGQEGTGEIQTLFVKENDSISQSMNDNATSSAVSWSFKETAGGTKVTSRAEGKMNFLFKVYTVLNGGVDKVIGTMHEKSLASLDKALDYEINTYSIKVNGLVKKVQSFYVAQTFTSELSKINKNTKIVIPTIETFCEKNNVTINGKPFVIYHTYDITKGFAKISICVPIEKEIFISLGSDIISGKLEASEGVKTTITGDYSHISIGYKKTLGFLNKNKLIPNPNISHIEIYSISKNESKNPSKWITEIYMPIKANTTPVNTYTPAQIKMPDIKIDATATSSAVMKTPKPKKLPAPKPTEEESSEF
jgi:effector-binding domain-containing protein